MTHETDPSHTSLADVTVELVFEDESVDYRDICTTGGELALSYVAMWRAQFEDGDQAAGAYTLPPSLSSAHALEVRATSETIGHVRLSAFDTVEQRGAEYTLVAQESGGVRLNIGGLRGSGEAVSEGYVLDDGPEKARALSGVNAILLAIDLQERDARTKRKKTIPIA